MTGVIALMGIVPAANVDGATERIWHSNPINAPVSTVTGNTMRWLEERNAIRAIWGMTRPIKPIGPHQAVTVAVSAPEMSSRPVRTRLTFTPALRAYSAPKRRALRLRI